MNLISSFWDIQLFVSSIMDSLQCWVNHLNLSLRQIWPGVAKISHFFCFEVMFYLMSSKFQSILNFCLMPSVLVGLACLHSLYVQYSYSYLSALTLWCIIYWTGNIMVRYSYIYYIQNKFENTVRIYFF